MQKRNLLSLALVCSILAFASSALATPSAIPKPTIGTITVVPNPVCTASNTTQVTVSTDLSELFDNDSSPTTLGQCKTNKSSGTITGYSRQDTVNKTTVTNKQFTVVASDGTNPDVQLTLDGTSGNASYTANLPLGPEGKTTVTLNVTASEVVVTEADKVDNTWPASAEGCTGTPSSSTTTPGTPSAPATLTSSASGSATYRTDLVGPTIKITGGVTDIPQGGGFTIGMNIDGGSSGADYTAAFSATNGSTTLGPYTESGTFKGNKDDSGIQNNEHVGPVSLSTSCNTPVGTYTLTAELDSNDLCGNPVYSTTKTAQFNVLPGLSLESQTLVISEFPDGEYGIDQCFNSILANRKINNDPGSIHIAEVVTSNGTCADKTNLGGVNMTLTLPQGFTYSAPGKSPAAHVFVFQAQTGFNYHYPPNEVTSLVTQTRDGSTITIDLSTLDVGYGPGVIPANWTIYARAKAQYTGTSVPGPDTPFIFSTGATETNNSLSNSSTYPIMGNPSQGCSDGLFPTP